MSRERRYKLPAASAASVGDYAAGVDVRIKPSEPMTFLEESMRAANALPAELNNYFAVKPGGKEAAGTKFAWEPPQAWSIINSVGADLISACLLPPATNVLAPVYDTLSGYLAFDEELSLGEGVGSYYDRMLHAHSLSSILLQQTMLPVEDNQIMSVLRPADRKKAQVFLRTVERAIPRDEQAIAARTRLQQAVESIFENVEAELTATPTDKRQALKQMKILEVVVDGTTFSPLEKDYETPEFARWQTIKEAGLQNVADNPFMSDLLVLDIFSSDIVHRDIRGAIFMNAIEKEAIQPQLRPAKLQALGSYYLSVENLDLHDYFREKILDEGEDFHNTIDWIFSQDPDTAKIYVYSLTDIKEWEKLKGKEKKNTVSSYLRKIGAVVAGFQQRNPEHENLPTLWGAVSEIAEQYELQHVTSPIMSVLSEESPGVVFIKDGQVQVKTPRNGETIQAFRRKIAQGVPTESVVHEWYEVDRNSSQPVGEQQTTTEQRKLQLRGGEFQIAKLHWNDAQVVLPGDVSRVRGHLQRKLNLGIDDQESKALASYTERLKINAIENKDMPKRTTAVFPELLLPDNPMRQTLQDMGIVSIEYADRTVNIVFDSEIVGINGSRHTILQGKLDDNNEFILPSRNFINTPLQSLLDGAALLAKQPPFTEELRSQEVQVARSVAQSFNEKRKYPSYPRVIGPKGKRADEPGDVVLWQMEGNLMVPLKVNWSKAN